MGSLVAIAPLSIDLYLPALPAIGRSFSATAPQINATLAAFLMGMAIGQIVYGPMSDRFGRRPPLLIGITIYVSASIVCAFAPDIATMNVARFVEAVGGCAGSIVGRAIVRDRFDHREAARMLSFMTLIMGLAPVLAPMIGGGLLIISSWRLIFCVLAVSGAIIGFCVFRFLDESRSPETAAVARSETVLRAFGTLLKNRRLLSYLAAGSLNGAVLFAYVSSSSSLLINTYGFSPQLFSVVFACNALAIVGSAQINRRLLKRLSPDHVLKRASIASLIVASLLLTAAWSGIGGYWTVLPLLFAALATFGLMSGNTMAGALSADPTRAGSIASLMGSASYLMGALAAWLAGLFANGTALPIAAIMFCCLVGSAIAIRFTGPPIPR